MPITFFDVTDISHDDCRMEEQLLQETGREFYLDQNWAAPAAAAQEAHTFLYRSDIEFILVKTDCDIRFRRIMPPEREVDLTNIGWDKRTSERHYIFKVDPVQKVIITGGASTRFFHCSHEEEEVSIYEESRIKTPLRKMKRPGCAWEAEDVYQHRDVITDELFPPEHLTEVARRFKAWRAMIEGSLFVYMMVPEQLSDREFDLLIERRVSLAADVSWVV